MQTATGPRLLHDSPQPADSNPRPRGRWSSALTTRPTGAVVVSGGVVVVSSGVVVVSGGVGVVSTGVVVVSSAAVLVSTAVVVVII